MFLISRESLDVARRLMIPALIWAGLSLGSVIMYLIWICSDKVIHGLLQILQSCQIQRCLKLPFPFSDQDIIMHRLFCIQTIVFFLLKNRMMMYYKKILLDRYHGLCISFQKAVKLSSSTVKTLEKLRLTIVLFWIQINVKSTLKLH